MSRYSIGIDLGTTHCAVSHLDLQAGKPRGPDQAMLPIPQLTALGTIEEKLLLPSFLYLPSPEEFPAGALALPWESDPDFVAGEFARVHGSKVPTRLIASAKSWLSHPGVDRTSPLLPWQAPEEVQRLSPLEVSARYLIHLRQAWNHHFGASKKKEPADPLESQEIILTVPASFDAAARELTLQAARQAGLPHVTLLEEPQSALYAWLEASGENFRDQIGVGEIILVVDVGGGTTDLSLIAVTESEGNLQLTRIAVGDHILLGGDNMDLALAHAIQQNLLTQGKKIDPWQFNALTYACREAKENLFNSPNLKKAPMAIPSRGSALIGGALKAELHRDDLATILTDGFFPRSPVGETPRTTRRTGLAQLALPYAQDPGITRHLASFLTRQARALEQSQETPVPLEGKTFVHPTAILFNGGVFKAGPLKQRVIEVINSWLEQDGGTPVKELVGADLDLSVARGAAYYGWVRQGHGIRIRGGTARAYYVGVESAMPAVPGFDPPVKALCVAPFGMEEGAQADIPPQEFGLVVGEPTQFRFFTSSVRRDDAVGQLLEDALHHDELEEVAPIETTLPGEPDSAGKLIPVNLQAAVTEVGTLELRCLQKNGPGRWKLELNVRLKE
jgi:hypothetical protein